MLTPRDFRSIACPTYPEIRLSLFPEGGIKRAIGASLRRRCTSRPRARSAWPRGAIACSAACASRPPITRNSHNTFARASRFPSRLRTGRCAASTAARYRCMVTHPDAAPGSGTARLPRIWRSWRRGVDTEMFKPRPKDFLDLPRPIAAYVGRVAIEKNIEAFLRMPWRGSKIVIGDGPERARLEAQYPHVVIHGISLRRGSRAASGRRRRHGVSEPHRHLRPGESRGDGLRRAGGRLSRHRSHRCDRGRRDRRAR